MISMVRIFFVRTLSYVNIFILILIGNGACVTNKVHYYYYSKNYNISNKRILYKN